MKRRDFLVGSASMLGAIVPVVTRSQSLPCPPPDITVDGQATVATPCQPTALMQLARSLSAGQSSTSLGDTGMTDDSLYTIQWMNRFHVDFANGRAHLIGKNAASQGGERSNCVYDMGSNSWRFAIYPGGSSGHIYESVAYDPARGEVYTGQWNGGDTLKRWTINNPLNSWTDPATSGFGDTINSDTQPAICWHPNLFGRGDGGALALKHEGAETTLVIAWRRSNNQWYTLQETTTTGMSGTYRSNGAIEYVAGGDFCIASFPPEKGGRTFRIDAGSNGALARAVEVSDPPVYCGYTSGSVAGILIDDPAGSPSPFILEKNGSGRVWRYASGQWTLKSYTHPFTVSGRSWAVATCRNLGVFWAKYNATSAPSRVWRPND